MIVGITGAICSGKSAFAHYLAQTHGFEAINVMEMFKLRLMKQRREARKRRAAQKAIKTTKAASAGQSTEPQGVVATQNNVEESKEEAIQQEIEDHQLDIPDNELGLEIGDKNFCHAYYQVEYKQLRQDLIREVFRDLTGKWARHFVVYPLNPCDDMKLML